MTRTSQNAVLAKFVELLFRALGRIRPYPYFRTNSHLTNTRIGHPAEVFLLSNTYARRPKDKAVSSR
jgi:hypothetical protein